MITTYDVRWACDVLRPVYDDVVKVLEDEGVEKFETSWATVTAQLTDRLAEG